MQLTEEQRANLMRYAQKQRNAASAHNKAEAIAGPADRKAILARADDAQTLCASRGDAGEEMLHEARLAKLAEQGAALPEQQATKPGKSFAESFDFGQQHAMLADDRTEKRAWKG